MAARMQAANEFDYSVLTQAEREVYRWLLTPRADGTKTTRGRIARDTGRSPNTIHLCVVNLVACGLVARPPKYGCPDGKFPNKYPDPTADEIAAGCAAARREFREDVGAHLWRDRWEMTRPRTRRERCERLVRGWRWRRRRAGLGVSS